LAMAAAGDDAFCENCGAPVDQEELDEFGGECEECAAGSEVVRCRGRTQAGERCQITSGAVHWSNPRFQKAAEPLTYGAQYCAFHTDQACDDGEMCQLCGEVFDISDPGGVYIEGYGHHCEDCWSQCQICYEDFPANKLPSDGVCYVCRPALAHRAHEVAPAASARANTAVAAAAVVAQPNAAAAIAALAARARNGAGDAEDTVEVTY